MDVVLKFTPAKFHMKFYVLSILWREKYPKIRRNRLRKGLWSYMHFYLKPKIFSPNFCWVVLLILFIQFSRNQHKRFDCRTKMDVPARSALRSILCLLRAGRLIAKLCLCSFVTSEKVRFPSVSSPSYVWSPGKDDSEVEQGWVTVRTSWVTGQRSVRLGAGRGAAGPGI